MDDVLIVGAGPVGLMLACELKLHGVRAKVIERLEAPTGFSKALGLQGRGVDLVEARGLLPRFEGAAVRVAGLGFHFSGIPVDVKDVVGPPPRSVFLPQQQIEAVLAERAAELGVEVVRGVELLSFEQTARSVIAQLGGGQSCEARYLVGCDGGRSGVREHAGIAFAGTEPTVLWRIGDVRIPGATMDEKGVRLPDGSRPPFGVGVPVGDGYFRVTAREPYPVGFDRKAPFELPELRDSLRKSYGLELPISEARWLSRFTDASRQATTYRAGRVFLAGDAAHTHLPAGGPGIATGFHDATNLAWKLAAVLRDPSRDALLDSYTTERHPAGALVLQHTLAQGALMVPSPHVAALRAVLGELFRKPEAARFLIDRVQGGDVRYGAGSHPFVGRWMPFPVAQPKARAVLLDGTAKGELSDWAGGRVEVRRAEVPGADGLLIRADGFVAWAADQGRSALEAALTAWV